MSDSTERDSETRRVVEGVTWDATSDGECWLARQGDGVLIRVGGGWRLTIYTETPEAAMLAYARSRKTGA